MRQVFFSCALGLFAVAFVACSSGGNGGSSSASTAAPGSTAAPATSQTSTQTPAASPAPSRPAPAPTPNTSQSPAPAAAIPDPNQDGPYAVAELDDTATIAATGDSCAVHCAYPKSGPAPGPYPVVVIGHGFQIPASQYEGYVHRLATFGYVALTVDFPGSLLSPDHTVWSLDLAGGLDWALAANATSGSPLAGLVDGTRAGIGGHSLGGKLALLAATRDARFKAAVLLDPVDGSSFPCTSTTCPLARSQMPAIPLAFLGETLDSTGGFLGQSCAPAADNYDVLYQAAGTPSLEVTIAGAGHMSFVDDVAACGFYCTVCQTPTLAQADALALARSFTAAFFERHLRGLQDYDVYLTGPQAQARYVQTGAATLASK